MAPNEYARSGFHSGETASGYFDESFTITIGGTDRTKKCHFETLEIIERADNAPNELHLSVWGFTPTMWQEIKIYDGGIDVGVPIFAGHILKITQKSHRKNERATFEIVASDYYWLMDRYALVTKRWRNVGIGTIVADVLANYTDGGFTLGYCSSGLGNVTDFTVYHERVSAVLKQLAALVSGAYFTLDYGKRVSIFTTPDEEGNAINLTNSATDFWDFDYEQDGSQVQTFVRGIGGGGNLTAAYGGGSTLTVDETGWYTNDVGGGLLVQNYLWADVTRLVFSSRAPDSGAGTITVTAPVNTIEDIPNNTPLDVSAEVVDGTANTNLATALGGSLSGQAMGLVRDGRWSFASTYAAANAQLARYKDPIKMIRFTTTSQYVRPGRTVTVNMTLPTTISATFRIQEVRIVGRRNVNTSGTVALDRIVTAGPFVRNLPDALAASGVV